MQWKDAIIQVLEDEAVAMHYADIAEEIVERDLRESVGATPANTVSATISLDLSEHGTNSVFKRVSRGEYMLREMEIDEDDEPIPDEEDESSHRLISAYGMFWRRNAIKWTGMPRLLGRQSSGADPVNLARQRGIYILHDRSIPVYVGQAFDRPIAKRLYEHTKDRLGGRWDRFSWFGVVEVLDDGELEAFDVEDVIDIAECINALESVLIEATETPQNRRQGDGFRGIEYLQVEDEALAESTKKELLKEIVQQLV